jgi:hypothetical protein
MEIDEAHAIYVYIPQSSDNVYRDMEISVIGFHGPPDKANECHGKIMECISADEAKNDVLLTNMLIGGGLSDAEDFYPDMDAEGPGKLDYVQIVAAFGKDVKWFTLESKKELRNPLYKTAHKTNVPYVHYYTGGFAHYMGGW